MAGQLPKLDPAQVRRMIAAGGLDITEERAAELQPLAAALLSACARLETIGLEESAAKKTR